jgi:hypothetical protein
MHIRMPIAFLAAASVAVLAAGCSGGSTATTAGIPSASQQSARINQLDRSGVEPKFLQSLHFGSQRPVVPMAKAGLKELVETDFALGDASILNSKYHVTGTITNGLNGPDGDFIDGKGNLYIGNYVGLNVQEYALGGTSPSFTYSSGLSDPIDVTTDSKGNVYIDDYSADTVVEFPQGSNTASATCSTGLGNEGVAVDGKGDVFVSGNNSGGTGNIVEYAKGLKGCKAKTLGVTLEFAGGLQIDKKGNLVACDQDAGVDIIPKPYNAVSSTITGAADTFHVALTANNKTIFIADPSNDDILVDKYPSGTPITTIGSAQGLSEPAGVATYPFQKAK